MSSALLKRHALVNSAAELIGTPFRLNGREVSKGIDCVGLVHLCLTSVGNVGPAPHGYRLRNSDVSRWTACAERYGLTAVSGALQCGDIALLEPGPGQQHLVICERQGTFIHAHAGLGRVIREQMLLAKKPLAHWRIH